MSVFELRYEKGGVFLPRLGLWLDPHHRVSGPELAFVSHAHSDHTGAHREVITTAATSRLMRARGARAEQEHVLKFDEAREFDAGGLPFRITLVPAGHILGSAMAFLEADGESLLYTGDFKLQPGLASEPCSPRRADWLVMETTFGRPEYRLPPAEAVHEQIVAFCRAAFAANATPILMAYSLGKTQELLRALDGASLPIALHEAGWKLTRIYEEFGVKFPAYERHKPGNGAGNVLIVPTLSGKAAREQFGGAARTAVITGWALDSGCRFRYQADAAFALSDHADFQDLLEFARRVSPRKVYTLHGFAADFAQSLRERGHNAQALSEQDHFQLNFGPDFGLAEKPRPMIRLEPLDGNGSVQVCERSMNLCARDSLRAGIHRFMDDERSQFVVCELLRVYGFNDWDTIIPAIKEWESKGYLRILKEPMEATSNEICVKMLSYIDAQSPWPDWPRKE